MLALIMTQISLVGLYRKRLGTVLNEQKFITAYYDYDMTGFILNMTEFVLTTTGLVLNMTGLKLI